MITKMCDPQTNKLSAEITQPHIVKCSGCGQVFSILNTDLSAHFTAHVINDYALWLFDASLKYRGIAMDLMEKKP